MLISNPDGETLSLDAAFTAKLSRAPGRHF